MDINIAQEATNFIIQAFGGIAAITITYIIIMIWVNLRKEKRLERIEHDINRIRENTVYLMVLYGHNTRRNNKQPQHHPQELHEHTRSDR